MNDILLTPIRLNELELLIQNSVTKALNNHKYLPVNQNIEDKDDLLTVKEAAKFLGISVPTIYSKKSRGELPVCKPVGSKRLFFSKIALINYVKAGKQKTNAEIEAEAEQYLGTNKKGGSHV